MKDRRAYYRSGLHEMYLPYYDALCKELPDYWQPTCGLRSFVDQDALYAKGRTTPGPVVTNARGGLSFHNYGLASDWDFFPKGIYCPLGAAEPKWQEYIAACTRVGVRMLSFERCHNEFNSTTSIHEFYNAYSDHGFTGVIELLEKEMKTKKGLVSPSG